MWNEGAPREINQKDDFFNPNSKAEEPKNIKIPGNNLPIQLFDNILTPQQRSQ